MYVSASLKVRSAPVLLVQALAQDLEVAHNVLELLLQRRRDRCACALAAGARAAPLSQSLFNQAQPEASDLTPGLPGKLWLFFRSSWRPTYEAQTQRTSRRMGYLVVPAVEVTSTGKVNLQS